jgi:microcystin-dependent protein
MSEPYLGEIRLFAGNFAPVGWSFCNGSILSIATYDALYSIIGTTYGGDGQSTFALPDLRSRVPVHQGPGFSLGQNGGQESVSLTTAQIPAHTHNFQATTTQGTQASPTGSLPASNTAVKIYSIEAPNTTLAPNAVAFTGGSQPHSNIQPFLTLNFIIALFGVYPTQN